MATEIPQPPSWPVIGNILDIDSANFTKSMDELADKYGEIYKLNLFGHDQYVLSSVDLVEEVCDESRFGKTIEPALQQVRSAVHDGLFTAHSHEANWAIAHRTLMPAFGPISIKDMFDEMHDIASQLVSYWARLGPEESIDLTLDTTRLTFDTIALCATGMRFNSFHREHVHPFINTAGEFLIESGMRTVRTWIGKVFQPGLEHKYQQDIARLRETAQECIDRRKVNPTDKKDLLNAMLNGKDPKTGQQLTEDSIMDNMITFLFAGHETTSALLAFTILELLQNPEALSKARQEVDNTIGSGPIQYQHMSNLPYIEAVLREAIRLHPSAPSFAVSPISGTKSPVTLRGRYVLPPDAEIVCLLSKSQRDPAVFGEDAADFRPERMLGEQFSHLRSAAWKPFGNGKRACIGRSFAWQEAILAMAMILQNFDLRLADPNYKLTIHETLTQKPLGLRIKASLRPGIHPTLLQRRLHSSPAQVKEAVAAPAVPQESVGADSEATPITILFGSASGTAEGLARSLASTAQAKGLRPTIRSLDEAVGNFPIDQPVIMIACTYEGQPPDNAKLFLPWLESTTDLNLAKAKFTIFGCGHRDWVSSYQRVPKALEQLLLKKGAKMFASRGETDVSRGGIFDDFDVWADGLWKALAVDAQEAEPSSSLNLSIQTSKTARAGHLRYQVQEAKVLSNERVTETEAPEKRHVTLRLPDGMQYEAGDYLAVLPINNTQTVSRVMRRFGLPWDAVLTIIKGTHSAIPANKELSIATVLESYVELNTPATLKNKQTLSKYAGADLTQQTTGSVLDILERHHNIALPFATFLSMLPPLRLRQYSISSSPLLDPSLATITFSVLAQGKHLGTATNYLKALEPDSTVQVTVRKCPEAFRLPADTTTPLILVCAGSGIAPFHAFLQQRALQKAPGEALLFVGCRGPEDTLFKEDLERWEEEGVVRVFYAYSRNAKMTEGCKYVQDRVWRERGVVSQLFEQGARAYICGSSRVGQGVSAVAAKIAKEVSEQEDEEDTMTYEKALKWWQDLRGVRYSVDVFD